MDGAMPVKLILTQNSLWRIIGHRFLADVIPSPLAHLPTHYPLRMRTQRGHLEAAAALRRHLEGTMRNLRKIKALLDAKENGAVAE